MRQPGFYEDQRYCERCQQYVPYLSSLESTFCAFCDARVRLFSEPDRRAFLSSLVAESLSALGRAPLEAAWSQP